MVIYILIEKYKYMVITDSDTILREYYITRKHKRIQYMKRYTKAERFSQAARGVSRTKQGRTGRKSCGDDPSFCCTPIVTEGSAAYSDQLQ